MNYPYKLFSSINEMLAPTALSNLLQKQVANVEIVSFPEDAGYSGSFLSYIKTDADITLVLKHITPGADWFITTTKDQLCRSATIYRYGLLDQLLPQIEHAILGCAQEGTGWAILMRDVSAGIYPDGIPLKANYIERTLDALAIIHAKFWNSNDLYNLDLGLCQSSDLIGCVLPTAPQHYPNLSGYIPIMIETGWAILQETLERGAFNDLEQLTQNPTPLYDALAQHPSTLVHGDFRLANLSYMPKSLITLFDWQMASRSLMTIDLAWFLDKTDFRVSSYGFDAANQYYFNSLSQKLGSSFESAEWMAMLELGFLVNTLRMACFTAWFSRHSNYESWNDQNKADLANYNHWIRAGLKWV